MPQPRRDDQATRMYALYQDGYSLAQVGQVWGLTRQSVYEMFRRRNWPLRERKFLPTVTYLGDTYTPDPDGYFRKTNGDRKWLHHAVWEHHRGPIPAGHDIHHRDENKANNAPENLECLTPTDHGCIHRPFHDTPEQPCLYCGTFLTRKQRPDGTIETSAQLRKRQYCNTTCHAAHKRGQPRGWSARDEQAGPL